MTPETLSLTLAKCLLLAALAGARVPEYSCTPVCTDYVQVNHVCRECPAEYSSSCSYSARGPERILSGLWAIIGKASKNVVNGDEAESMSPRSFYAAVDFALRLEDDVRDAYVGVDPDGEVYFEWYDDSENQCTVTFSGSDDRMHCMKDADGRPSVMVSTEFADVRRLLGDAIRI